MSEYMLPTIIPSPSVWQETRQKRRQVLAAVRRRRRIIYQQFRKKRKQVPLPIQRYA